MVMTSGEKVVISWSSVDTSISVVGGAFGVTSSVIDGALDVTPSVVGGARDVTSSVVGIAVDVEAIYVVFTPRRRHLY